MQNKNRAVTEVCIRFEPETEGQSGSTGALLPYDRRIPFDPSCFDRSTGALRFWGVSPVTQVVVEHPPCKITFVTASPGAFH
jgi:hypothetical protein